MDVAPLVVGIDVAASRPSVAVAVRADRRGLDVSAWCEADEQEVGDRARLLDWLDGLRPSVVAITAAQRPRRAGGEPSQPRRADAELLRRRIAVAPLPTRAQAEAGSRRYAHTRAGWDYFRELRRRGYESLSPGGLSGALGQAPAVLEIYPHAGFVTLLDGTPPSKGTREGLHLRVLVLRRLGLHWDEYYDAASLDALMAAFTAWRVVQGLATSVGDERDGCVWLPVTAHELRDTYAPLTIAGAREAVARLGSR
jgi:predicted nuclease with RNAse H fold